MTEDTKDKIRMVVMIGFAVVLFLTCLGGALWTAQKITEGVSATFTQFPR
jgi:hypothetical protein